MVLLLLPMFTLGLSTNHSLTIHQQFPLLHSLKMVGIGASKELQNVLPKGNPFRLQLCYPVARPNPTGTLEPMTVSSKDWLKNPLALSPLLASLAICIFAILYVFEPLRLCVKSLCLCVLSGFLPHIRQSEMCKMHAVALRELSAALASFQRF